jgi:hypothetical protein
MSRQSGTASPIDYAGVSPVRLPAHGVALSQHGEVISSDPQIRGRISSSFAGEELCPGQMRKETRRSQTLFQDPERNRFRKRHNTVPLRRKPFVLCGVDTEQKGRVSRPLTCNRG